MLALGIILVIVAALALIAALVGGSDQPANFDLGIFNISTNTLGVFLIGAVTVLVLVLGLVLVRTGTRSANRRRKDKKELHRLAGQAGESGTDRTGDESAG